MSGILRKQTSQYDLSIFGDLFIDILVENNLSVLFSEFNKDFDSHLEIKPIYDEIGGILFNVAKSAKDFGFNPFVIGSVGNDLDGKRIIKEINKYDIDYKIQLTEKTKTGKVIILRDKNNNRLMIADSNTANGQLSFRTINSVLESILESKYIYIPSLCLLHKEENRFKSIFKLLNKIGEKHSCKIIVDLVPHDIYKYYDMDSLFEYIYKAKLIISNLSTVRRLMKLGYRDEIISNGIIKETCNKLKKYFPNFILRYGEMSLEYQLYHLENEDDNRVFYTNISKYKNLKGLGDYLFFKLFKEKIILSSKIIR